MRTLLFLLQKEFRQIFRDPSILRIIFVMPIIQLMILPWAADYEVKDIRISIVDHDQSPYTRQLVSKITSSGYFKLQDFTSSYAKANQEVETDKADLILEIPAGFERELVKEDKAG